MSLFNGKLQKVSTDMVTDSSGNKLSSLLADNAKLGAVKGISPSATPTTNYNAIQQALNIGGRVFIGGNAGDVYQISDTLIIGSNTSLEIAEGVELKLVNTTDRSMIKNSNTVGTAGYLTSGSTPSTDISGGTANQFGISIDLDQTIHYVTLTLTGLNTGAAIASAMQTAIRAISTDPGYASATVSFTNGKYVITSGTKGPCSVVRTYAGQSNDVTSALQLLESFLYIPAANVAYRTDGTAGNTNITVKGGIWNFNRSSRSLSQDYFNSCTMVFNNTSNLTIINPKIKDTQGYAMLITNFANFRGDGIYFANTKSDGIHFQGPIDGLWLHNTMGRTNDDMIAFTIGDWVGEELSRGNIRNVYIDGVYPQESKTVCGLYGNDPYTFTNINFSNIRGRVYASGIHFDTSQNLFKTVINNISIKNIDLVTETGVVSFGECTIRDITIDNISSQNAKQGLIILSTNSNVSNLKINNIKSLVNQKAHPIYVQGTIGKLVVDNASINLDTAYYFIYQNQGSIDKLLINNATIDNAKSVFSSNTGTTINDILVNNLTCYLVTYIFKLNADARIELNNARIEWASYILYQDSASHYFRVMAGMVSKYNVSYFTNSGGSISLNGSGLGVDIALLNAPVIGDVVFNEKSASLQGVGLYFCGSDNAWHKLA